MPVFLDRWSVSGSREEQNKWCRQTCRKAEEAKAATETKARAKSNRQCRQWPIGDALYPRQHEGAWKIMPERKQCIWRENIREVSSDGVRENREKEARYRYGRAEKEEQELAEPRYSRCKRRHGSFGYPALLSDSTSIRI